VNLLEAVGTDLAGVEGPSGKSVGRLEMLQKLVDGEFCFAEEVDTHDFPEFTHCLINKWI
jgi:hypothetical protein